MIKKVLLISLIVCGVASFAACDSGTAEPTVATADNRATGNEGSSEKSTEQAGNETTEPISEQPSEPASEPNTEPTSHDEGEKLSVSNEDFYEKFENYSIKKIYLKMTTSVGLNVRKGPSESYERVDGITRNQVVDVVGQCVETGWYKIKLAGKTGYVSNEFLTVVADNNNLVLGDECPYKMYVKTAHDGQLGWFYRNDLGWQPIDYKNIVETIKEEGYKVETFPVYVGTWRDVGDVMWLGYSKK